MTTTDARMHAPATERNRDPILAVLARVLAPRDRSTGLGGDVLEIASGTGQHVAFFAAKMPALTFQPSDPDPAHRASIAAWAAEAALDNLRPPLALDVTVEPWPIAHPVGAILCINMIHISPWAATEGLMAGAGRVLPAGAPLCLYGPYIEADVETAPSNLAFDADLRRRDPAWGLRELEAVKALAASHGLTFGERVAMPANNLCLLFRR